MYSQTIELYLVGSPTATVGYTVTPLGVSCADKGMVELDTEDECKSAIPTIQDTISDVGFGGDVDLSNRPGGCYYKLSVFWNTNKGGACSSCRSVCKG